MANTITSERIVLKNVRISHPYLFEMNRYEGVETKYSCVFLMDKSDNENKNKIKNAIKSVLKEGGLATLPSSKLPIQDGGDKENYQNLDVDYINASNKRKPQVFNSDKTPLDQETGKSIVYPGCYVNAIITLWLQNNRYGKRVNVSLHAVQFSKHGEPFGDSHTDFTDGFEDVSNNDDDLFDDIPL